MFVFCIFVGTCLPLLDAGATYGEVEGVDGQGCFMRTN